MGWRGVLSKRQCLSQQLLRSNSAVLQGYDLLCAVANVWEFLLLDGASVRWQDDSAVLSVFASV